VVPRSEEDRFSPLVTDVTALNQAHPGYPGFASHKAGHAERHTMQLRKPFGERAKALTHTRKIKRHKRSEEKSYTII
jgi:hypothetical protein